MISFKKRHFNKSVILMAVRWYVAYALSYRDIEEMMAERGIKVDHATVNRWVVEYAPLLEASFTKKYKMAVHTSWRMDETYIKVKGEWLYQYRAVDKYGHTIDFFFSEKRDTNAAHRFFNKAIGYHGKPEKITIDKSGLNNAALEEINKGLPKKDCIEIRKIKYLNNIVEQDHRFIKKITKPMKGFKAFASANATLIGIELHHMLRKQQHCEAKNMSVFEQFYALAA